MIAPQDLRERARRDLRLLPARLDDFEALAMLFAALHGYNAAFDEKFALAINWKDLLYEHFLHTCTTDGALWLLAWLDDEPVGLLVLENHMDSPLFQHRTWVELVALYVTPSCRKMGLAHQLMKQAEVWTATRGSDRMQLYVTTQNEHARAFYRSTGWRPVQEIWRKEVEPLSQETSPLANPSRSPDDPAKGCRTEVLESGHYQFAMKQCLSNER
ncbi:MAG TPA: GNAT family N-acetyltransferase [Ktedonobacteraceae bacterium]